MVPRKVHKTQLILFLKNNHQKDQGISLRILARLCSELVVGHCWISHQWYSLTHNFIHFQIQEILLKSEDVNIKFLMWKPPRLLWILQGFFRSYNPHASYTQIYKLSIYAYQLQIARKAMLVLTPGKTCLLSNSPSVWSTGSRTKPIILGSFSSLSPESSQMLDLSKAKRKISLETEVLKNLRKLLMCDFHTQTMAVQLILNTNNSFFPHPPH